MAGEHKILSREKILTILTKIYPESKIDIQTLTAKDGVGEGQNFSGQVQACDVRALVDGQVKEHHWMVKFPPNDPNRMPVTRASHMEQKEIQFFSTLLPAFEDFIKERKANIRFTFKKSPYSEYHEEVNTEDCQKSSMLVMEHMGQYGFRDCSTRHFGLDMDHVKLVLEEVAKFHAVSYVYFKTKMAGDLNDMIKKEELYCRDFFSTNPGEVMQSAAVMIRDYMYKSWSTALENAQKPGQDLPGSLKRSIAEDGDIFARRAALLTPDNSEFNVLNHGDVWFNNFLFKYDNGQPVEMCLVDVAVLRWASPCTDLAYFLFSSTTPQFREVHLDAMLSFYQSKLAQFLAQLGDDPNVYPLSQLKVDFNKYALVGFVMSLWTLPTALMDKSRPQNEGDPQTGLTDVRHGQSGDLQLQLNSMVYGNFMDMVKRGVFTL
ncbi:hypothetical protein TCAL_08149 [Tigriopus californicus]|uniref:CHK kinase-like domain-containing protein n=1 Tax=Tigriopus californicus TaxID=6832 RepID=A0A553P417_TIGCA|nr:uncharacterized protein LOC131883989 [Tigriopus californicus]TRY72439.1 hypothetical protein TCAL_08149 [Tigriopus californicus]|eukprot:TCALIF_08149-PA protein Name:"Protein of unknown function" AED:0.04 eAED:0.04 QI:58/1/1/1/1/1/3/232/432